MVLIALGMPAFAQDAAPIQFRHLFRGEPLPVELKPYQVEDDAHLKSERDGLRIALPDTYLHPIGGVGIRTTFAMRGDFDAIVAIELVDVETPSTGGGAGIGLAIESGTIGVQLRRHIGSGGKHWLAAITKDKGLKQTFFPCTEKLLRLRLRREGEIVHYLWAPGVADGEFQEIHRYPLGTEPIDQVRVFAFNNQVPCKVDVLVHELSIQGVDPTQRPAPGERALSRLWLVAVVVLVAGLLAAFVIIGFVVRRRRSLASATSNKAPGQTRAS